MINIKIILLIISLLMTLQALPEETELPSVPQLDSMALLNPIAYEAVAELPAPEKSKILRPVDRGAIGDPGPNDESTPGGLARRWGGDRPQKDDFAAADSFAGCLNSLLISKEV